MLESAQWCTLADYPGWDTHSRWYHTNWYEFWFGINYSFARLSGKMIAYRFGHTHLYQISEKLKHWRNAWIWEGAWMRPLRMNYSWVFTYYLGEGRSFLVKVCVVVRDLICQGLMKSCVSGNDFWLPALLWSLWGFQSVEIFGKIWGLS